MNQEETLLIFVSIQDLPQDPVDGETSSTANQTYRSKKRTDTGLSLAKLIMKQIVLFPVHCKQTDTNHQQSCSELHYFCHAECRGWNIPPPCVYTGENILRNAKKIRNRECT